LLPLEALAGVSHDAEVKTGYLSQNQQDSAGIPYIPRKSADIWQRVEGVQQGPARLIKLFDLPAHARSPLLAGYIDEAAAAYFGQLRQQPARTAIEGCLLFRPQVQQRDEQIGRHM
jgi:hypothetical protein